MVLSCTATPQRGDVQSPPSRLLLILHNYSFGTVEIYCASPVNYKLILSFTGLLLRLPYGVELSVTD